MQRSSLLSNTYLRSKWLNIITMSDILLQVPCPLLRFLSHLHTTQQSCLNYFPFHVSVTMLYLNVENIKKENYLNTIVDWWRRGIVAHLIQGSPTNNSAKHSRSPWNRFKLETKKRNWNAESIIWYPILPLLQTYFLSTNMP